MTWVPINPQYPDFQYETWRNEITGEVLVLEHYHDGAGYNVYDVLVFGIDYPETTLPAKRPTRRTESLHKAARTAREYRQDHRGP